MTILSLLLCLGAGRVELRGGKTIEGDLSMEPGAVVVKPTPDATGPSTAAPVRVPLDQIARLLTDAATRPSPILAAAPGANLPAHWKAQDIGDVYKPGATACDAAGAFNLTASGWGAWGSADSIHFAGVPVEGDGQIIARIVKLDLSSGPVVAGVMVRQSLAPDAPMAAACLYPSGEIRMPRRPMGQAAGFRSAEDALPPRTSWVRLARRADHVVAYRSQDGKFWERFDGKAIPLEGPVLFGIAAWTTGNSWVGSATIDSVRVVPGTPRTTWFDGGDPLAEGIIFRDGRMLAARIVELVGTDLCYEREGRGFIVPLQQVARLVFNPQPPDPVPAGRRGILLANGDYLEGELAELSAQYVAYQKPHRLRMTMQSILFGKKSFDAQGEVIAIDLADVAATATTTPTAPAAMPWSVRLADGSLLGARAITLDAAGIAVDGTIRPIAELRRN